MTPKTRWTLNGWTRYVIDRPFSQISAHDRMKRPVRALHVRALWPIRLTKDDGFSSRLPVRRCKAFKQDVPIYLRGRKVSVSISVGL